MLWITYYKQFNTNAFLRLKSLNYMLQNTLTALNENFNQLRLLSCLNLKPPVNYEIRGAIILIRKVSHYLLFPTLLTGNGF